MSRPFKFSTELLISFSSILRAFLNLETKRKGLLVFSKSSEIHIMNSVCTCTVVEWGIKTSLWKLYYYCRSQKVVIILPLITSTIVKFTFSEKATKNDKIFTFNLTVCSNCQIDGEDFVIFEAFLENMNFNTAAINYFCIG